MTAIVFSKDRALQLDAFLRSFETYVWPVLNIEVLYLATSERHHAAYQEVFGRHRCAYPRAQGDFRADVLSLVPDSGAVVLFVDDQMFVRPWRVTPMAGLSLRLAPHLTHCYTNQTEQAQPSWIPFTPELLSWRWSEQAGDWSYPISLDGHVFEAHELRLMLAQIRFHSPNSLEEALQRFAPEFAARQGYCYHESKVVNVPWNKVQTDCDNRHEGLASADDLLAQWEAGQQVDLAPFDGLINASVHQAMPLRLEAR